MRKAPMRQQLMRVMLALFVAGALLLSGAVAASGAPAKPNDAVQGAGCKDGHIHHNWGNNSYPTYQYTLYLHWCWSTGASSSRITDIRGSGFSDSTTIFRDKNASGPQTANHINILPSERFGNTVNICGWFQSDNCLLGKAGLICSPWTWHRSTVQLTYGGGLNYLAQT